MTNKKLRKKRKYAERKAAKRLETATIRPPENTLGVDYGKLIRNTNGS